MPPILFSPPNFLPSETEALCWLFEKGLQRFHVRKKTQNLAEVRAYIQQIPQVHHTKIVLHNHFELLAEFEGIGGLHFNVQNPFSLAVVEQYPQKIYTESVHSLAEISKIDAHISYCFLSPIYDSISKQNYHSSFEEKELQYFFSQYQGKTKVVALGGIRGENLKKTLSMGFDNVAILGYIWGEYEKDNSISSLISRWESCI